MANSINYAEQYRSELDQVLRQSMLTGDLEAPNVQWLRGKTFHIPTLGVTGYQDHSRQGGWNRGDVTVTHEAYTVQFDRDVEFFVDQMDVDESNLAASVANITREFLQAHAGPEVDAYRFSKLADHAINEGNSTEETVDPSGVLARLKADILKVRKYGPSNLICYISSEALDALEMSEAFNRNIQVQNAGTAIETRVTSLDGVRLVEVWDVARFNTQHDFTEGFVPEGQDINWVIVYKGAVVAVTKINSIYMFAPGQHTAGDGYLYQNRMYHDLFVMKQKADGVVVSIKPDDSNGAD